MKNENAKMGKKVALIQTNNVSGSKKTSKLMFEQIVTGDLHSTTKTSISSQHGQEFSRLDVIEDCPKKLQFDKTAVCTHQKV